MTITIAKASALPATHVRPLRTPSQRSQRRWSFSAWLSLLILGGIISATLGASWLAPFDPTQQTLPDRLHPPAAQHWLGADHLGRDLLSRLLYGGRSSLLLAAVAVLVTATVGVVIGSITARVGGFLDEAIMRLVDLLIIFPHLVLALVIATLLTPSFGALLLALTVTGWTTYARLARALTLDLLARPFIEAAGAVGVPERRLLLRHILPNILGPILAMTFLRFGHTLLTVAGLSYLGVGIQPPTPDWGAMIAEAQPYMQRLPLLLVAPALMIFLTSLCVTLVGQRLTHTFDPRQW